MRIDKKKVELILARTGKLKKDIVAAGSSYHVVQSGYNHDSRPETVYKVAKALGVDVTDIIED